VTALVWDKAGDRQYETGIDRGVLYLTDGTVVPWNGLVSIVESRSREVKSDYLDGVKYQDYAIPGDYSAKLTAFTYPDQLDLVVGNARFAPGVTVYDQPSKSFHLSYRTLLGNDLEGLEHGYKIHVVYNILAVPTDVTSETVSESAAAGSFEWDLVGTPMYVDGFRATNHISVDSRTTPPVALHGLESALYGTASANPVLPPIGDLLDLLS
jgi:hypothetical protein